MVDPPKKYKRMFPGIEVRLMNAYFVTCTGYEADEDELYVLYTVLMILQQRVAMRRMAEK